MPKLLIIAIRYRRTYGSNTVIEYLRLKTYWNMIICKIVHRHAIAGGREGTLVYKLPERERGDNVYYTSPRSFIITFSYSLASELWGL